MPEPTTATATALATLAAGTVAVPTLSVAGVSLGIRPDLLIAGFSGALVAVILLNSVPGTGDTWRELLRTTGRRMAVACASALTAGYLTPLLLLWAVLPDQVALGAAFAVGGGAQKVLRAAIARFAPEAAQ